MPMSKSTKNATQSHHGLNAYFGGRENFDMTYERLEMPTYQMCTQNFIDLQYLKQISMNRNEFEVTTVKNKAYKIPLERLRFADDFFRIREMEGAYKKVVSDPKFKHPVARINADGSFAQFKKVRDIAASRYDVLIIDKDGCILTTKYLQLSFSKLEVKGSPVFDRISALADHFAAVTEDGKLYTWGRNDKGQCGHPIYDYTIEQPRLVESLPESVIFSICAPFFTCVVTESRNLYVFGSSGEENYRGFVHKDRPQDKYLRIYQPRMLPLPHDAKVSQVVVGTRHILVLTNKNQLLLWHYFKLGRDAPPREQDDWSQLSTKGDIPLRIFSNDHFFGTYNISPQRLVRDQSELFNQAMTEMLTNRKKYPTDFTLIVNTNHEQLLFPVHKIVLFARREAFNQLFGCELNLHDNSIKLMEDSFDVVDTKIKVLYTGIPFDDSKSNQTTRFQVLKQAYRDLSDLISFTLDDAIENYCDVALESEGKVVYCHKLILGGIPYFKSMFSGPFTESQNSIQQLILGGIPYFKSMFSGPFTESQNSIQQPIQIINYSYSTILAFVSFLYSRDIMTYVNASNCVEVLLCAHEYNMEEMEPALISIIAANVDNESVESVLDVAERYSHSTLSLWCKLYIITHLDELNDLEKKTKRMINDYMCSL
ncbi:serine/threonine-protein kinase Nek9 [Acrasis kona]|uniref:Serine/threonine-protein kinase Nek9 n=1 Tax=Acrasis kona TaxID=1008807 RepID=A0AAW2YIR4_9EUKA